MLHQTTPFIPRVAPKVVGVPGGELAGEVLIAEGLLELLLLAEEEPMMLNE